MVNRKSISKAALIYPLMLVVSSCTTNTNITNIGKTQKTYKYEHQCMLKGQPVEHFITVKVPLTLKELAQLKPTLEENLGLDFNSCVLKSDLNE